MITYASLQDFLEMQDINKTDLVASGIITANALTDGYAKIRSYLERATRFIERMTRRTFIPYIESRSYPVPYATYDLAIRRFPNAHLKLFADLLEPITVNNGVEDLPSDAYFMLENNIYPKTILAVKYPYYWSGSSFASRYDQSTITVNGMWGYADYRYPTEFWVDTFEVVPLGGMTNSQTTLTLSNVDDIDDYGRTRFLENRILRVDSELMLVQSVNTTTNVITIKRGINGSTATTHLADAKIKSWRIIEDIIEATLVVAKVWRESDIAAAGRLGVSDYSAGVEVDVPADALKIIKSYERSMLM